MKAVILAAGMGKRLAKYTYSLPKGMLRFRDKPLIAWQIDQFKQAGIEDISIVTGYKREKIQFPHVRYYHNPAFATTNMIASLMCLNEALYEDDLIIAYSDILFSQRLLLDLMATQSDITVAVDQNWRPYWLHRYGTTETDLESLTVKDNHIVELGKPIQNSEGIEYRYIGLNKFSRAALIKVDELYAQKSKAQAIWHPSGKEFAQGYFTDLINELIITGVQVKILATQGGWLEFDTDNDYEMIQDLDKQQRLSELIIL